MLFQLNKVNCKRQRQYPSLKQQRGVVIVMALLIVAMLAMMAYTMMARLARDTQRTLLILNDTQAALYAQGSIEWAKDQLRNDWERQKKDRVVDATPIESPTEVVNAYTIRSIIYDMQARFNINNLTVPDAIIDFKRLIQAVDAQITEEKAQALALAVAAWIKPIHSREDSAYYLKLSPPYRAAHRPMFSVSELQLVKGMTPALYQALKPYVIALPLATKINIQTADATVLLALSPHIRFETAEALVKVREHKPFFVPEDFLGLDLIKNHPVPANKITTVSDYFLVETEISIEKQRLLLYTLLERAVNQNKVTLNVLWQSKGIF